jgi:hypothetical protein
MRCILPIALFVAGCGSSSSTPNDMQTSAGPDLAASSCSQTVDTYCAAAHCVRDTGSAQLPSSWCPDGGTAAGSVTLQHCAGGQTVIVANYADSADHLVYAAGALVAIFTSLPHGTGSLACVAGPATFAPPSGCDAPTTLCAGP